MINYGYLSFLKRVHGIEYDSDSTVTERCDAICRYFNPSFRVQRKDL